RGGGAGRGGRAGRGPCGSGASAHPACPTRRCQAVAPLLITPAARELDEGGNRSNSAPATTSRPITNQVTTHGAARPASKATHRPTDPTRRTIRMWAIPPVRRSSAPVAPQSAQRGDGAIPTNRATATSVPDARQGAATGATTTRLICATGEAFTTVAA